MALEVVDLEFWYENQSLQLIEHKLLANINFSAQGVLQIKGKNGSGKTTLLRLLAGILEPLSGEIRYNGHSIFDKFYAYQNFMCYVGHKLGLNLQLTVFENCYYYLKNSKTKPEIIQLLKTFNLDSFCDKLVFYLSEGQKKRLSLLKALLSDCNLWILDEPFVALDKDFIEIFKTYIHNHLIKNGVIIYTSHQNIFFEDLPQQEFLL